jgi:DNA-binding CsgD family transcriptional regulator
MAERLSQRMHEITRTLADACIIKEIACLLDIRSWTVSTHPLWMSAKLDVITWAAIVARLVDPGVALRPVLRPTA